MYLTDENPGQTSPGEPPRGIRLVDGGLVAFEASQAGFAERYRRGETPHTVHVWWARRPHTAMRALVFACLWPRISPEAVLWMSELSSGAAPPPERIAEVRAALAREYGGPPRVLDMFGGGGTIPYEAALLGADAYSVDSNELSVFLQRSLLTYRGSPRASIPELVERSGKNVLYRLAKRTECLFPKRGAYFGYLWSYSLACRSCGYSMLLSRRPWLSKKGGKRIAAVRREGEHRDEITLRSIGDDDHPESCWLSRVPKATCPKCKAVAHPISLKETSDELVSLVSLGTSKGKDFHPADPGAVPDSTAIRRFEEAVLSSMNAELPGSLLPKWSGIVNPSLYGIDTHSDFLNPRQRAVLVCLIDELQQEYRELAAGQGEETAKGTIGILSGLIDQLVDWNCRLSMWISQNEQVGRAFSGPGVPMLWDYVETDPLLRGPANLWSKLDRIVAGARALGELPAKVTVQKAYAQALPFDDGYFDAIVTDPPYYDNIFYNVLADFFYAWKKLLFRTLEPSLFVPGGTDDSRELVASTFRSGSAEKAHERYCEELNAAILEAARVLKSSGVFALIYSHASFRGWLAILLAYRSSPFTVESVQPLSIERKARPRAMTSVAVNTCMIFVARKHSGKKASASAGELRAEFEGKVAPLAQGLRAAGWEALDIAIASFAQGVGLLANVSSCSDADDISMLKQFEAAIRREVPEFRVADRKSL